MQLATEVLLLLLAMSRACCREGVAVDLPEAPPPKKAVSRLRNSLPTPLQAVVRPRAGARERGKGKGAGTAGPLPLCASMTTLLAADPDDKAAPRAVVQLLLLLPLRPQSLHLLSALKAAQWCPARSIATAMLLLLVVLVLVLVLVRARERQGKGKVLVLGLAPAVRATVS